jgi:hypothetical protein
MKARDLEKELASLRETSASLEKQVAVLKASKPPAEDRSVEAKRVVEHRGVTITPMPDQNPSFVMPSGEELGRLHEIVIARYPQFTTHVQPPGEAFDGFRCAFPRIGHLGRDKLNDKLALVTWIDDAALWLSDNQVYPNRVTVRDFVCAVLAHGDVDYIPLDRFPFDCSAFGLRRDSTGRPATDAWRAVLTTKRLRDPVPPPRSIRL